METSLTKLLHRENNGEIILEEISVGEFVKNLIDKAGTQPLRELPLAELLKFGHIRGWLEDSDERHPEAPLNRQTAARIVHQFLRIECEVQDMADISRANCLRDLYTCRVCTNHIAQVYVRGIMTAEEIEPEVFIFNHLALVTKSESCEIISYVTINRSTRT